MGFAKTAEPFVCGGSAATFASVIIHPIDLAKVCFTSFVGWKRLICAATHGTQCTYVSRPGRHKVPAMIGRKAPVASLGDLCPKFWMGAFVLMCCNDCEQTALFMQLRPALLCFCLRYRHRHFAVVRALKSVRWLDRPPIIQAASATYPYFCYDDGAEGSTNQLLILFHSLSLS